MSPRKEDDGGPSDEEGSSASEQIQQTPSNEQPADASTVEDVHNPATDDGEEDNADNSNVLGTPTEQRITPVTSGYESFGGKSISSAISSPKAFKHEDDTPDDESISTKSRIANKTKRGQVLVHYHPQLGDEGFESTLVPDTIEEAPPTTPSSRGRPMDESSYYSGGAAGMNSRMMEDVRDGRTYNSSSEPPSSPMNDEQNNAATRQIRRRVFRAALERGIHDERRMKMLDADADIGGPSLRGGGAVNKNNGIGSSTSYHRNPGGMNSRSRDTDDEDIPQIMSYTKTNISTRTPKSYETNTFSPTAATQQQTISPPAPPAGPPSYRTIIQKLIKDNEPQKLPQLDKVLAKYDGREEELILKLDARYKKMKQKSDAILQDLETSEKQKEPVSLAARSGEGKQSLEDHGGIKQMNSWDSKKSKDVYFVKVPKSPLHGAIKLPSDIIDSNKTAPHSNVRKALAMEDEEDGDIPAIPKCNAAPAEVAAAAAANEAKVSELRTVEQQETLTSPTLREPYKFNMAPSYGDEISVITMETKETLKKKKNDRGEDTYSWLQRPPNSITVEGGSGSKVEESPLSPERKSKINKLLPDFDQEKEEDKAKASDAKLVPVALNDVEARIRARRKIMEEEAKNKAVSDVDAKKDTKTKIEKDNDGFSDADNTASIIEDAESFVGKRKSAVPASTQEDEVQPSLIDHQERLLQAASTQSKAVKEEPKRMETTQAALEMGGDDDLDEEEDIDLLLKESRLQAEKAIALRKAQRELEKEKKARMEAEAARIALEEELARLKAEAAGDKKPIVPQEENVIESDSDEDDAFDVAAEDQGDTPEEPFKYDLNKTFSSVSDDKSEQENVNETVLLDATLPLEDADGVLPDGVDIAEASAGSVESSENEEAGQESSDEDEDEDLSAYEYQVLDSARGSVVAADEITPTQPDGMMEEDVDKVEESSPIDSGDIISPPSDEVATKKIDEKVDQSLGQGANQRSEHDFPSTTMVHASPSQDVLSEQKSDADEVANINHVATMMFEGNRAKGQLSFTTGSKILAHSNQRGPWWLGRCGKQTGWFPANAVVPESEYLKNIAIALPAEMDETGDRLRELSNEELAATYDLIRNPSDPIDDVVVDDDDDNDDDDDPGSPARSRWLDDTSNKNATQSSRSDSPPPTRSDPSMMEGLNQRLYEPNESNAVDSAPHLGFEGMNRLGKSIEERSEDKPKKTYIGPPQAVTETDSPTIVQTNSGSKSKKKKKPQEWKVAQDPGTGLTYYYHLKTRETTWEKPVDFDEAAAAEKDDAKGKGLSGGKILRIFSKKKKPKTPTEDESVTPSSTFSFSFDEKKPAAKAASNLTTENVVVTRTVGGNASGAIIFPEHDDDDDSSSSDGSSLFSRENIYNKKKKLQNSVRKFTDKFSQEVISPKNSYEQLSGGEEEKMQIEGEDAGIELNYPVTSQPKKANPVHWRSAIDAATGRTYYYQKGGTETFWTKPKDMP